MKQLTDQQYLDIWRAAMEAAEGETSVTRRINMGRAAYEAAYPLVIEEDADASCVTKIDPAVEAAWQEMREQEGYPPKDRADSSLLFAKATRIVAAVRAAVRAADAKAGRA